MPVGESNPEEHPILRCSSISIRRGNLLQVPFGYDDEILVKRPALPLSYKPKNVGLDGIRTRDLEGDSL